MSSGITIVWFQRDLRMQDNLALIAGVERGNIVPVFIWSPEEEKVGTAAAWWLHHSLLDLDLSLRNRGTRLILRKGKAHQVLKELIEETGADGLFFNERYEPYIRERNNSLIEHFDSIEIKTFHSNLIFPPHSILNKQKQPYKVFTPFWKECRHVPVSLPKPAPVKVLSSKQELQTLMVEDLELLAKNSWDEKFSHYWEPGEKGALTQWNKFIEDGLDEYEKNRDFPKVVGVSRLSPHLTWGEISPRWIWHHLLDWETERVNDSYAFLRQLVWREFAYHQMVFYPEMVREPLRKEFLFFPWINEEGDFSAWKEGRTGFPLIDAGMRELWETGWMHNRVRMAAASFLVKHLMVSWNRGASWFEETLLDWDMANNSMGWQWVTGSGFDASPFFRIFNPITQGKKFDANGDYVRRWIPELAGLPNEYIHNPWKAPLEILQEANVTLGVTYPFPIVDHPAARRRALEAYEQSKNH